MGYEIEAKAPVEDASIIESRVRQSGGELIGEKTQVDIYLSHPCRDMRGADEALRLRLEGGKCVVTFKGARMKGNLKSREELEFSVGEWEKALEVFSRLGFKVAARVCKVRREYRLLGASVAIDRVEGLGDFVEIEAPRTGTEMERSALVESVATMIGVDKSRLTTKSYVELLESRSSESSDSM
ncbi:MAG: class IV adenylate cyclase [Candidatus Methanosuratincola petrocarbonis]